MATFVCDFDIIDTIRYLVGLNTGFKFGEKWVF